MQQAAPTALEVYEALRSAGVKGITYEDETGGGNTLVAAYLPHHHVIYANTLCPMVGVFRADDPELYVEPVKGMGTFFWDYTPSLYSIVYLFRSFRTWAEDFAYEMGDEGRHEATDEEIASAVADLVAEVESLMADGTIPRSVRSYGELHDFIDANDVAGFCDPDSPRSWWSVSSYNRIMDAVDTMLANGDFDKEDEVEAIVVSCPVCGCDNDPLGSLAKLQHYRCRDCGAEYSAG